MFTNFIKIIRTYIYYYIIFSVYYNIHFKDMVEYL